VRRLPLALAGTVRARAVTHKHNLRLRFLALPGIDMPVTDDTRHIPQRARHLPRMAFFAGMPSSLPATGPLLARFPIALDDPRSETCKRIYERIRVIALKHPGAVRRGQVHLPTLRQACRHDSARDGFRRRPAIVQSNGLHRQASKVSFARVHCSSCSRSNDCHKREDDKTDQSGRQSGPATVYTLNEYEFSMVDLKDVSWPTGMPKRA
jgi:hypothetical protein